MNNRSIMYSGIVTSCLLLMSYNSYTINRTANVQEFIKNLFHERNIVPLSIFGALQIELCTEIYDRYIGN